MKEQVNWFALWLAFQADMPKIARQSTDWQQQMLANGDLASNLLNFADSLAVSWEKQGIMRG